MTHSLSLAYPLRRGAPMEDLFAVASDTLGIVIAALGTALAVVIGASTKGVVTLVKSVMAAQLETHRVELDSLKLVISDQTAYYKSEIIGLRAQLDSQGKRLVECEAKWDRLGIQAVTGSVPQAVAKGP